MLHTGITDQIAVLDVC